MEQHIIPGIKTIKFPRFSDHRGWLQQLWVKTEEEGAAPEFVQENLVFSKEKGTLRGLHFQKPPHSQSKLIAVLHGSILDIAVDLRKNSPHYGTYYSRHLGADAESPALIIPKGFAHGYITTAQDTLVLYKVDCLYAPTHEAGLMWNDPDLAIDWQLQKGDKVTLSERDSIWPPFHQFDTPFTF